MISSLLAFLLWTSLSGSILIGLLLLLKPRLSSRISPGCWYVLWIWVVVRLLLPFGMGSHLLNQVLQSAETKNFSVSSDLWSYPEKTSDKFSAEVQQVSPHAVSEQAPTAALPTAGENQNASSAADPLFLENGLTWLKAHLPLLLIILWAFGAAAAFLWFILPYRRLINTLRTDTIPADEDDQQILRQLSPRCAIPMAYQPALKSPCLVSLRHPLILLPGTHYVWEEEIQELQNILRHELIHAKRKDLFFKWLAVIASCLHWFNPLMSLMRRRLSFYCELSCDEAATRSLSFQDKQSYGATLLRFACASPSISPLTTAMCQEKKELKERLESIMNDTPNTKAHIACSLALFLVIVALTFAIGPGSHVLADESSQEYTAAAETTASNAPAAETPSAIADNTSFSTEGWILDGEENTYYVEVQGKTVKLVFNSVDNAPADDSPYWEMRRNSGLSEEEINQLKATWAHKSGADIDLLSAYGSQSTNPEQHSYLYLISQALEKMYELSGKTFDELYFSINEYQGLRLFFSVTGDNNKESFFDVVWGLASEVYEADSSDVSIGFQSFSYRELSCYPEIYESNTFSPISLSDMKAPENMSSLSWEELAKWYLINYSITCDPGSMVELTAEPNTYDNISDELVSIWVYNAKGYVFDLTMDRDTGALISIYGPYPDGEIEH